MIAKQKSWRRPELIVLVRNRPEEAVLAGCKLTGAGGPPSAVSGCRTTNKNGICQTRDCSQHHSS
jgi:hypothetical protein